MTNYCLMRKLYVQTKAPQTDKLQSVIIDAVTLNLNDAIENSDFLIFGMLVDTYSVTRNEKKIS